MQRAETQQDPLFVKCREVNDFHHAKDAYLNIVVGNTYHVKFTRNPLRFVQSRQTYSMNHVFDYDVAEKDGFAWKAGEDGSIAMVRRHDAQEQYPAHALCARGHGRAVRFADPSQGERPGAHQAERPRA